MTKKLFLFLVEGLSDKDALEPILSELIDNTRIHFEVLRCDLTAENSMAMRHLGMKQRITNVIKNFLENNHGIQKRHIEKIIFLSDTDGCYIDQESIYYSKEDLHFRYEDDGIYTDRPEEAILRNVRKSRNLNMIYSTNRIFGLCIETYYFSCNLDHVVHEVRNLKQNLKEEYAFKFADRYEDREEEFIDFVSDDALCLDSNYENTWEKIKHDNNSLLRYTNLMVFFYNNREYLKEEVNKKITLCYE